jgi:hypothetical protein
VQGRTEWRLGGCASTEHLLGGGCRAGEAEVLCIGAGGRKNPCAYVEKPAAFSTQKQAKRITSNATRGARCGSKRADVVATGADERR